MNLAEPATFLRVQRSRLRPADVGLPDALILIDHPVGGRIAVDLHQTGARPAET